MKEAYEKLDVVGLTEEIVPAGALVETKRDAVHYITVLVIGYCCGG